MTADEQEMRHFAANAKPCRYGKRPNSDTTLDAGKSHAAMNASAPFGTGRIYRRMSCY